MQMAILWFKDRQDV